MKLTWKREYQWDGTPAFQVLWKATTPQCEYFIARTGTADHAEWHVLRRRPDGWEDEPFLVSNMLSTAKSETQRAHDRIGG